LPWKVSKSRTGFSWTKQPGLFKETAKKTTEYCIFKTFRMFLKSEQSTGVDFSETWVSSKVSVFLHVCQKRTSPSGFVLSCEQRNTSDRFPKSAPGNPGKPNPSV
jgi:hypothetical protein